VAAIGEREPGRGAAMRLPGLFEQIRLVAQLRWRILRNGLKNKNRAWDLVGVIVTGTTMGLFVIGVSFAFYFGTARFLTERPSFIGLQFWGIFVWWQILPIFVTSLSPEFSFRTLLRFPLKLSTFYIIGLAYGLADSAAIASLLWLGAMVLATAFTKAVMLPAMLTACALFVAVNVTFERLVGSWMEKLLAKRRTRELFFALIILLSVGAQFIGMAAKKLEGKTQPTITRILPYFRPLPPSLAGRIVSGSADGETGIVLECTTALVLYAAVFGGLLWRRYAVQYRGEELSETAAPTRTAKKAIADIATKVEKEGRSFLPAEVSAMVGKELRYLLRNSFTAISLLIPPVLVLFFSMQFAGPHATIGKRAVSPQIFFPGMMAYLVLMLMAPAYNAFAYEGRGMQTYFMVPVRFRDVLLGKNLTQVSVLGFEVLLCIGVLAWRIGLPAAPVFLATMAAIVFSVAGQLTIANWSSLSFPKKMEFGKTAGQRQSGMAVLIAFAAQIVFAAICGPILFAGRWTGNAWLPAASFAFLAVAAVAGYFGSLDAITRLAEKKKERLLETLLK
jgi:ABC-2 type transport system permease protein